MSDLLALTGHLPEIQLAPGDEVVREDTRTGSIWVLVSGSCDVLKNGISVNAIDRPGAAIGEVAVLTGADHSATVVAAEPTVLRFAEDGRALLTSNPEILFLVAGGLAERLEVLTRYLADLRHQYSDAPGLGMVQQVLGTLLSQDVTPPQPGSAREPNPEY